MKYIRRPFSLIALIAAFAAMFAPMTALAGDCLLYTSRCV